MRKLIVRVVVFPRYTTLVGTTAVYTPPTDIREYGEGTFVTWMGTGLGATPATVQLKVQVSSDLVAWSDAATISPGAGAETLTTVSFDYPWMRVKATVSGGDPGVCLWMRVELVPREEAAGGGTAGEEAA